MDVCIRTNRTMKVLLIAVFGVVSIIVTIIGASLVYSAIDREDSFYIEGAKLWNPDYLDELQTNLLEKRSQDVVDFGFSVHRLVPGTGTVFGYRFYSNGSAVVVDDESYRKVSVWLPQSKIDSHELRLSERSEVIAVYSEGGSAWPRSDCSGYIKRGIIEISRKGSKYAIHVRGNLEPTGNVAERCQQETVDLAFEASRLGIDSLTPWLGDHSNHPYEETYR